jgi:hypothetical protein
VRDLGIELVVLGTTVALVAAHRRRVVTGQRSSST